MINKIVIKNFRSIKNLKLSSISNTLGLIGENSSGKSSIIAAILLAFGEKKIDTTDFRINQHGQREKSIQIGLGIEFDYFAIQRLIHNPEFRLKKPEWFTKAEEESKVTRNRDRGSKSYSRDFRQSIEATFNHSNRNHTFYFKLEFSLGNPITEYITLTNKNFTKPITDVLNQKELKEFFMAMLPKFAYLRDERQFEIESKGSNESTTNELFNLMLPRMTSENYITEEEVADTKISELSILQINQFLLKKVQLHANEVITKLNENFKEYYQEDIKVDWNFSNNLFENLNIQTNFYLGDLKNRIDFQSVGSGTRSMYKMVLLQTLLDTQTDDNEPVLFLLEEPELYLYPKLERQMSNFIKSISKNNQVIVTTHSHMSILNIENHSLFKITREKEYVNDIPVTKARAISSSREVMDILGYDITYLLGKDYLIFVEGKDDARAYETLINKVFGKDIEAKFITMTSVSKLSAAINFNFIEQIKSRSKSIYIVDSDGNDPEQLKKKVVCDLVNHEPELKESDIKNRILITEYSMLECYTFEKNYLKNSLTETEFRNKKLEFIQENIEKINGILQTRLGDSYKIEISKINQVNVDEYFELIRKYGFTKKLVRSFRGKIGGSGFKKLDELTKDELEKSCSDLINSLKTIFFSS